MTPSPSGFPEIACTLGTTTDDPAVLAGLVAAGMGVARVNTAYGSLDEIGRRVEGARRAGAGVLLDLKGPQLRVECTTEREDPATGAVRVAPCRYPVAAGDLIYVGHDAGPVRFNHDLEGALAPGDTVCFENGTIRARVLDPAAVGVEPRARAVLLEVLEAGAGRLSPFASASVPGRRLDVPHLTGRDREVLALGARLGVEWYALSFARDADDLRALDDALVAAGVGRDAAGLVPKIEEASGIERLEEIVTAGARGRRVAVMIARGDLFVELPWVRLPAIQEDLVRRCRALDVPSIVATGLLLSMQEHPRPARSEVCDVAAAARQGATSFLLSDETSNGRHPVEAARALAAILAEVRRAGGEGGA